MNVYDSERMADLLRGMGLSAVDDAEDADIVVLNTCHIREKAAEKIYSDLGRLVPLKRAKPDMMIGVAGCVAQAEGEEMLKRAPVVDMVFGPQSFHQLPNMVRDVARAPNKGKGRAQIVRLDFPAAEKFAALKASKSPIVRRASAFLTIQEGCDKFCTFCVVPYTRGGEVSRSMSDILEEAHQLTQAGVSEITLLGQNVNAWACPEGGACPETEACPEGGACPETGVRLADLLAALAEIDALQRLRFTTSHPRDMDDALINAFGTNKKLMPSFHLPVQSGSDSVLKAMNRKHTAADYLDIIARLRAVRPDIALTSDFIVGFPGESDADFDATLALIDAVGFAQAFSFKYSPRPGTPAANAPQVPEAIKSARLARLQAHMRGHQRRFNDALVGRILPVLFEPDYKKRQKNQLKKGQTNGKFDGQLSGRSPYLQPVHVSVLDDTTKSAFYGRIVPVRIEAAGDNSLRGCLLPNSAAPVA